MWNDIKETGNGETRWRFVIEGYPTEWVTHYDMEGTGSHGRNRRVGLLSDTITIGERAIITESKLESKSMTIRIVDIEEEASLCFMKQATKIGKLASNILNVSTTIIFQDGQDFSSNDVVFIDGECVRLGGKATTGEFAGNSFTGCLRGYRDTIATYHYVSTDSSLPMHPYIADQWVTPERRRCFLYAYGDDEMGDGTLVFQGIVQSGPAIKGDQTTYEFDVDSIASVFEGDLGVEDVKDLHLRGYFFNPVQPWALRVYETYPLTGGNATKSWYEVATTAERYLTVSASGFYETPQAIVDDWNVQYQANDGAFVNSTGRFILDSTDAGRIVFSHDIGSSRALFPITINSYGTDGGIYADNGEYTLSDGEAFQESSYNDLQLFPKDRFRWQNFAITRPKDRNATSSGSIDWNSPFNLQSYIIASGPTQIAHSTRSPLPSAVACYVSRAQPGGLAATEAQINAANKFFLSGDPLVQDERSWRVVISVADSTAITPIEAMLDISSIDQASQSINVKEIYWHNFELRHSVFAGENAVKLTPSLLLVPTGSFYHFISASVSASPKWSALGVLPALSSSMFDLNEISGVIFKLANNPLIHERRYEILSSPENMGDFIAEELKLISCVPKINISGAWSIARIEYSSLAEAQYEIGVSNQLTDGGFGDMEWQFEGIRNRAVLKNGYSFLEGEHKGEDIKLRWAQSELRYGNKKNTYEIAPFSAETKPIDAKHAYDVIWRSLSIFGEKYRYVSIDVPFSLFDAVIGTPVILTNNQMPNEDGGRGLSSVPFRVVGREMRGDGFGTLILFGGDTAKGYSPSLEISSGSMTANNMTGTFQVYRKRNAPYGLDDVSFFEVGHLVQISSFGHNRADTWAQPRCSGSIVSINATLSPSLSEVVIHINGGVHAEIQQTADWSATPLHIISFDHSSIVSAAQALGYAVIEDRYKMDSDKFGA